MFLDFYNLRDEPFGVTPDPKYLYLSPTHREALASLIYGIKSGRGFMTLVAEPGMGKTTLLFSLLERLRDSARTAFLFHTQCNSVELLRHLLSDLGIDTETHDVVELHQRLNKLLVSEAHAGRQVVAIIDEAQNLSQEVLESIRLLSNFETPSAKLIQLILSGQPLLAEKLASSTLKQLSQRLAVISHLEPLTANETYRYIDHRASIAGSTGGELFDSEARTLIAAASEGIPRNVNKLCFAALSLGCALRRKPIDGSVIREVISDFDFAAMGVGHVQAHTARSLASSSWKNAPAEGTAPSTSVPENSSSAPIRETAAGVGPVEQAPAQASRSNRYKSRSRTFVLGGHVSPRREIQTSAPDYRGLETGREEIRSATHSQIPPRELAGDLLATYDEADEDRKKPNRWEMRAALISCLIMLAAYAAVHFLSIPILASRPATGVLEQYQRLKNEVQIGLQKAGSSASTKINDAVTSHQTDLSLPPAVPATEPTESSIAGSRSSSERSVETAAVGHGLEPGAPRRSVLELHLAGNNATRVRRHQASQDLNARPNGGALPDVKMESDEERQPSGSTFSMSLLKVVTDPPGADVRIDGRSIGKSPTQALLSDRVHRYRLSLNGFPSRQGIVDLTKHEDEYETTLKWDWLGYESGLAKIQTDPAGAAISIDGTPRGMSPRTVRLTAGLHHLVLALPGYQVLHKDINVPKDQTIMISSALSSLVTLQQGVKVPGSKAEVSPDSRSRGDQE